ncbi:MAG: sugar porter family MFS transporter [Nitrospirae bacterium]|nr:sugar porter family MFS transporter [Nitrospirota bacterium]
MTRTHGADHEAGTNRFVYIAAAISALGGMLFGYDTGVISGAVLFIQQDFSLSPAIEEVVVGSVVLGAVLGAVAGGTLTDRFGRRIVLMLTAALFALSAVGTALAPTVTWLIIGRVIVGVAIGVASFTTPLYISEISPVDMRGRFVSFNQIALTGGIVVAYLVDYALSGIGGWRWMFGLAAIPSALLGIGMVFMPESPRWLMSRGQADKGRSVLQRIRGTDAVDEEVRDIQRSSGQQSGRWSELAGPLLRPAMIVGIGLALFQQVTGINTVIYYAPTIFQSAGFESASVAILATAGVGVINVLMTVVALLLLDRVGRRPLLLIGMAGMVISLGVLGAAFLFPRLPILRWVAAGSLMLYVGSFAVGLGPVFWLLISEIYPLKTRGLAMSIATVANWSANLLVALTFLTLVQIMGRPGTFWLYGLVGIGAWIFAYILVPETKGRSLEDIETHWRAGKHPREMGR